MEGRCTVVSVLDGLASRLSGWTLTARASLLEGLEVALPLDGKVEIILGHTVVSDDVVQLRLSGMSDLVNAQAATLACDDVAALADEVLADAEREKRAQSEAKRAAAEEQRRAKVEKAREEAAAKAAAAERGRVVAQLREVTTNAGAAEAARRRDPAEVARSTKDFGARTQPMEEMPRTLLSLDDDMLLTIARKLLARDLRSTLRLLQTCTQARARLDAVKAEAAAAAAAEADAAFADLQREATEGDWSSYVTRQGDWAISGHQVHKEDSMSVSTSLYYLRAGQRRCVRQARWREHDTMRGGNDGSKLTFGVLGELLEHQFEGGTDRLRLADLLRSKQK